MRSFFSKQGLGIGIAAIALLVSCLMPGTEALSHEGALSLGVLAAGVAMWVCKSFPIGITGILILAAGALVGAGSASSVFSGFGSSTTMFMIGVFGLTAVFNKSRLSRRLVGAVSRWAKTSARKLVLGVMAATALVSMFMTDTAVIALFYGLALALLEGYGLAGKGSGLSKCLFIGVPFAGITGGIASPAGNSTNIVVSGLIESATGSMPSFFGWMAVGVPLAAVMIIVLWLSLITVFKPEALDPAQTALMHQEMASLGPLDSEERKTLALVLIVPLLWIASTWLPALNTTAICVLALGVALTPSISLITFEEYAKAVPWNVIFMVGSVISLGSLLGSSGAAQFLGDLVLATGVGSLGIMPAFLIIGFLLYGLHTFVPIGPGFIPVFFAPLAALCATAGINPIAAAILLAGITGGNYLFPINPTLAITYREENYRANELLKAGLVPTVVLIMLMATWIPLATSLLSTYGMI